MKKNLQNSNQKQQKKLRNKSIKNILTQEKFEENCKIFDRFIFLAPKITLKIS